MEFDLHLHSYFSLDAINNPRNIARFYSKKGMGFAITDHNDCQSWPSIRKYARHYGVEHVLGEEIKVYDNGKYIGEFLGLFLNAPIKPGQYEQVLDELEKQAAIVSVAHPFDVFRNPLIVKPMFREKERARHILKRINAVEGHNSRVILNSFNSKAVRFAKENNLAVTGGSDGHFPQELGNGFTVIDGSTSEELYGALKKNNAKCNGRLSSPFVHVLSQVSMKTKVLDDKTKVLDDY